MNLNIVIPTYNRALYLARAVSSIASQIHTVSKEIAIDVVIYDNASTDSTPSVCQELKNKFPFVRVMRRDLNIGADANILQAIKSSVADYTWVFGDDDYLLDDTLSTICDVLKDSNCCLLKLSAIEDRDFGDNAVNSLTLDKSKHAPIADTIELSRYISADDILIKFGLGMGNFSSLIIANSFFYRHYSPCGEDIFSSGYSQLAWIYKGLAESAGDFCFIENPLLVIRIEISPRGLDQHKVNVGISFLRELLQGAGYSKKAIEYFCRIQRSASYLAFVKQEKINGRKCSFKYLISNSKNIPVISVVKALVISFLPLLFFMRLWSHKK